LPAPLRILGVAPLLLLGFNGRPLLRFVFAESPLFSIELRALLGQGRTIGGDARIFRLARFGRDTVALFLLCFGLCALLPEMLVGDGFQPVISSTPRALALSTTSHPPAGSK